MKPMIAPPATMGFIHSPILLPINFLFFDAEMLLCYFVALFVLEKVSS